MTSPPVADGKFPPMGRGSAARLLIIVSRTEPGRYEYLRHVFGHEGMEVIVDRRIAERRRRRGATSTEKRRGDRRVRNITSDLLTLGWALVRR